MNYGKEAIFLNLVMATSPAKLSIWICFISCNTCYQTLFKSVKWVSVRICLSQFRHGDLVLDPVRIITEIDLCLIMIHLCTKFGKKSAKLFMSYCPEAVWSPWPHQPHIWPKSYDGTYGYQQVLKWVKPFISYRRETTTSYKQTDGPTDQQAHSYIPTRTQPSKTSFVGIY